MAFYFAILALVISLFAQSYVQSSYNKYRQISTRKGMRGADVAKYILESNNIYDVDVVQSSGGVLSDHFDPNNKRIALSPDIYNGTSVASVAVAAHEVGHAIQYDTGYVGIKLRNTILKPSIIASQLSNLFIVVGILMIDGSMGWVFDLGLIMLMVVLAFQVLTLPIEFDASKRALANIENLGIVGTSEHDGAKSMLTAAALTYVAAVVGTALNLLRFISIRNSRRD